MSRSPYRPLERQVALVTGGSSGIEAAVSVALAGAGAVVGINYASDPKALRRLLTLIPYGRIGHPGDVGRAAVWLASDDSDYVTVTPLFVDGGMTLYPGFRDNG
jgi:NAD(P)-dependent dehydrogenase (short-subunit alcohol dehydrogenase family)